MPPKRRNAPQSTSPAKKRGRSSKPPLEIVDSEDDEDGGENGEEDENLDSGSDGSDNEDDNSDSEEEEEEEEEEEDDDEEEEDEEGEGDVSVKPKPDFNSADFAFSQADFTQAGMSQIDNPDCGETVDMTAVVQKSASSAYAKLSDSVKESLEKTMVRHFLMLGLNLKAIDR